MYLAMNRFTVKLENAEAFEEIWLNRESHLQDLDGFVAFHMLKSPPAEDGTLLYASHTVWESQEHFLAWTRSAQFRASHAGAKSTTTLYEGVPHFEGFEAIQEIRAEPR